MSGIEEQLRDKGICIAKTQGDSMEPMLIEGRCSVMISRPQFPLKKYDVPVYRRDGHYTMHRIIGIKKGRYLICGDNRIHIERDIEDKDIIGVLTGFYRDGNFVACDDEGYIKYAKKVSRGYYCRYLRYYFNILLRKLKKGGSQQ